MKLTRAFTTKWMGKAVIVTAAIYGGSVGRSVAMPMPARTGWVVGFRYVHEYDWDHRIEDGTPAIRRGTKGIPCARVRFWPTEKERLTPIGNGLVEGDAKDAYPSSIEKPGTYYRKALIDDLRQYAADTERDSKGRFVRYNPKKNLPVKVGG